MIHGLTPQRSTMFSVVIATFCTLLLVVTSMGCGSSDTTAVRFGLRQMRRVALFGLTGTNESVFMARWMTQFPGQTFVERAELNKIVTERELAEGTLSDETRAKLADYGVHAVILTHLASPDITIRVVDTKNGAVLASTFIHGKKHTITRKVPSEHELIEDAIDAVATRPVSGY